MESIFPLPPSVHWTMAAGCSVSAGDCGPGQIQVLPSLAVPSSCTAEGPGSPPLKYPIVCRVCLFTCMFRYEHTHMFVTCSGPSVGNVCTSQGKKRCFVEFFFSCPFLILILSSLSCHSGLHPSFHTELLYLIALCCTGVAFTVSTHCRSSVRRVSWLWAVAGNSEVKVAVVVVFDCQGRAGFVWPAHSSGICSAPLVSEGLHNH